MSRSDCAGTVGTQAVVSRSRVSRLSTVYVARTPSVPTCNERLDQLDGLVLSSATEELPLDTLLGRVPCSKRAGLDCVRRLANLGLLTIHRVSEAAPSPEPDARAPEIAPASAAPIPHRVFRKPESLR
jgi:hypothetical protein